MKATILQKDNARTLSRGSPARAKVVREIRRMGLESWKEKVQYGKRWRVEIFFSALKRVMNEVINAKRLKYQIHQTMMKIYCYFLPRRNTVVN